MGSRAAVTPDGNGGVVEETVTTAEGRTNTHTVFKDASGQVSSTVDEVRSSDAFGNRTTDRTQFRDDDPLPSAVSHTVEYKTDASDGVHKAGSTVKTWSFTVASMDPMGTETRGSAVTDKEKNTTVVVSSTEPNDGATITTTTIIDRNGDGTQNQLIVAVDGETLSDTTSTVTGVDASMLAAGAI